MHKVIGILTLLVFAGLTSGCIVIRMKTAIKYDEPPRVSVKFESAEAASIFYSKLRASKVKSGDPSVENSRFGIPFIIFFDSDTIHANAVFNALVEQADINGDGTITLEEAKNLK